MKALVVVDLQKDFVQEDGALYTPGIEKIVPEAVKLIEEFQSEGLPIIVATDYHTPDDEEFKRWPPHCIKGTEGAELIDQVKQVIEGYEKLFVIRKNRYSAMYNTDLEDLIKKHGVDEVHLCGLLSNICVMFTVEELMNRDYHSVVHEKAIASNDPEMHRFALRTMEEILGAEVRR